MKRVKHSFATFPEFSKLTFADREAYEKLIEDYPPIIDISFPSVMTWWNVLGSMRVSVLNGNLVLSYWLPGDEKSSGLALVGINKVDESLCTIFDYLEQEKQDSRLVHVSEFVLNNIRFPELFACTSERSFDECVLLVDKFAKLENMNGLFRWRIKRFFATRDREDVIVKQLDLQVAENRQLLLDQYELWKERSPINNINKSAEELLFAYVNQSGKLGIENLCIFYQGELQGYVLFSLPSDPEYVSISIGKFSYDMPGIFEVSVYKIAQWLELNNVKYANIDIDSGNIGYRTLQIVLGPAHFFRKYTIRPMSKHT